MLRIFGNNNSSPFPDTETIVTLGMFDGVHLGHKKVISDVVNTAKNLDIPSVALTFDIHPRKILGTAPAMICSLEHRLQLLSRLELDSVWVISFTEEFSKITAKEFTDKYILRKLSAKKVILGENGNFGFKGRGNLAFLNENYPDLETSLVEKVIVNKQPVSSSLIREYTSAGNIYGSRELLGRAPSVLGRVVKGRQIGRTIGVPTLNINPDHELLPPNGVYATITRCGDSFFNGITNIGTRPTFNEVTDSNRYIENNLFGFQGDLYDHSVEVFFVNKIRDEKKFSGLGELKENIYKDINEANNILTKINTTDIIRY